jgi:hypothetical protein
VIQRLHRSRNFEISEFSLPQTLHLAIVLAPTRLLSFATFVRQEAIQSEKEGLFFAPYLGKYKDSLVALLMQGLSFDQF